MNTFTDKIKDTEYIYSSYTKWGLKRYTCDIAYFTEESLDDLYYVICSILETNDGIYDKRSLGILLGFCMVTDNSQGLYYDVAEVRMFEDILRKIEDEHLIIINNNDVILTNLGSISIKEQKHYHFFKGTQAIYEHSMLKSDTPTALLMFPFYSDMGIYTVPNAISQIWPEDDFMEEIIYSHTSQLTKRLELQSKKIEHIYSASIQDYFDIETKNVFVRLYKENGEYILVITNGDSVSEKATELICNSYNEIRRENIVLKCLFQKLWDDKTSVFSYETLEPYFELVDYEELTKDSRTVWNDCKLLEIITKQANQTCWRNITRNCDVNVICHNIDDFKEKIDWTIFSGRVDDDFLVDNFLLYPWDIETISSDPFRKDSVIENLILQKKKTTDDWDWNVLGNRLSEKFVLDNIDVVGVDLSKFTNDTEGIYQSILQNPEKQWDWIKIEREFSLQFICDNIQVLGKYLLFTDLFDRVFTDYKWSVTFLSNKDFENAIIAACGDGETLSSAILNDKHYLWSKDIIDLLLKTRLISWGTTQYMVGFECNPFIEWEKDFFNEYSSCIVTDEGYKHVSQQIIDISIIVENPDYNWDWNILSANERIINDINVFSKLGYKINWSILFEHSPNIELLQATKDIDLMIADDDAAWTSFSRIADINYIISKYNEGNFSWDWAALTERMFNNHSLKIENLGNKMFIDKWDWAFLSANLPIEFVYSNIDNFKNYWNWNILFPRILNKGNKFDYNFLDTLAISLTNISGTDKCNQAWSALTSQYSFNELKRLIKDTVRKRAYWWDMNYFCLHPDFNIKRDLDECRDIIDWDILSSSESLEANFKFNPKLKIKPKAWYDEVRALLSDSRNKWNFKALSHFESLYNQRWFVSHFREKIDWLFVSQKSILFAEKDKQKLNELIEAFKRNIVFNELSKRNDVDIEQIIKINPYADYDYNALIKNGVVKATLKLVEVNPYYNWDWSIVSSTNTFVPTAKFLLDHLNENLNWLALSKQDNQSAWGDVKLIETICLNKTVYQSVDWFALSTNLYFPISDDILNNAPTSELNWKVISGRKTIIPLMENFIDFIDWKILSKSKHLFITQDTLERYKDKLDWSTVCHRDDFSFTNEIVERFSDYIDWDLASSSLTIKFSLSFVEKFKDNWNWPVLVKNKAFHNNVDVTNLSFVKQTNVIEFIKHFPCQPKAYHFTHMSNAVKIIKSMKLQSRDYADGKFSNSAGSNVYRTNKAHRFARFYFAPKSPTQFYNECLGKDKDDRYYHKAFNLGLPKCPMPVFFIFDVEELLMTIPDKCYYSNGNMQKDSVSYFKVVEEPNVIKAREIFINSMDTFNERQQEFLVDGELDFSKLKKVRIVCYDNYQARLLKQALRDSPWLDNIVVDSVVFEQKNKELYFNDLNDNIRIHTDYVNDFEFRVSYVDKIPSINNKNDVIRQRDNNIYVSDSLDIKKDTAFEVYFEVKEPRIGSWLIYKNK